MYINSQLNALGGMIFDETLSQGTACVTEKGLYVCPNFWGKLNDIEKDFLIDHEMLHLILKHFSRFPECTHMQNMAADAAINSLLKQKYCGKKEPIDIIPTLYRMGIFPCKNDLPELQSAEFYLEAYKSVEQFDCNLPTGFDAPLNKNTDLRELENKLDIEKERKGILAGIDKYSSVVRELLKSNETQPFLSLLKSLTGNHTSHLTYDLCERFTYNRRNPHSILPTSVMSEGDGRIRKNNVVLFLDYSSSCDHLRPIFEQAYAQIPKNFYNITTYVFATDVAKYEKNQSCYRIGSGTNFKDLPGKARENKYDMVWVFTDGFGTNLDIPLPLRKKWNWFLEVSPHEGHRPSISYIPKGCNIHFLSRYVI